MSGSTLDPERSALRALVREMGSLVADLPRASMAEGNVAARQLTLLWPELVKLLALDHEPACHMSPDSSHTESLAAGIAALSGRVPRNAGPRTLTQAALACFEGFAMPPAAMTLVEDAPQLRP